MISHVGCKVDRQNFEGEPRLSLFRGIKHQLVLLGILDDNGNVCKEIEATKSTSGIQSLVHESKCSPRRGTLELHFRNALSLSEGERVAQELSWGPTKAQERRNELQIQTLGTAGYRRRSLACVTSRFRTGL